MVFFLFSQQAFASCPCKKIKIEIEQRNEARFFYLANKHLPLALAKK
jgi:hypothetical protein